MTIQPLARCFPPLACPSWIPFLPGLAAIALFAASASAATTDSTDDKSVTVLSPFTVDTSLDRGYQAENTLSGSRLNSSLRDTPASVSVFTKEFLEDIGLNSLSELTSYSVNGEMNVGGTNNNPNSNELVSGQWINTKIDVRGVPASQGLDYFKSITPDDSYRIGRYDESRGPNGILFGISDVGGLINQTSKAARLNRDSGRISHSFGSFARNRSEVDLNKVLLRQKLAVSVAALHQENGGRRIGSYQDKERIFGALVFKPSDKITLNVMGESGRESRSVINPFTPADESLAWLDNRNALGAAAVAFPPRNVLPTAAQIALGVTARAAAMNATNRRATFIQDDGTVFDASGTYLTGSYNNPAVRAPDGTPGRTGARLRINDPGLIPYTVNANGPGMFRDQRLNNYTLSLDWELARNLVANLAHNFQTTALTNPYVLSRYPELRGDANTTLGVNGPNNPYAAKLYMDANWIFDDHSAEYEETRLSLSYQLHTRKWGAHRVAGMVSKGSEVDRQLSSSLGLLGAPFNPEPNNANNLLTVRNYWDEQTPGALHIADWRTIPRTLSVGTGTYNVGFIPDVPGPGNYRSTQDVDTRLVVLQSHFFKDRLVTTIGYREDDAVISSFGTINNTQAVTRTHGVVFHALNWLSLIANTSTSIGLPDFTRTIFPDATIANPSKGKGQDFGLSFSLLDRRISAKVVYFKVQERGNVGNMRALPLFADPTRRIAAAFESVLVGAGRPISAAEWAPRKAALTPAVSGGLFDLDSEGFEMSTVANPTPNWRLVVNYSYTDRLLSNSFSKDAVPWYGFKVVARGLAQEGVTQRSDGTFIVDPNAFESGGTVSEWLRLSNLRPEANVSTLSTQTGVTVAQELFTMINDFNQQKRDLEQRWGLRPHKVSLFTAYDFKEGRWKGFSVGGGYRWRSANIAGADSTGREIRGRAIEAADMMLRYRVKLPVRNLKGNLTFQVNIINLFDQDDIIPGNIAATSDFIVPGGRGIGYSRFELVEPRSYRFTTTYEF